METLLLAGIGACSAAAAALVLPAAEDLAGEGAPAARTARFLARRGVALVRALGRSPLVDALLARASWREAAAAVQEALERHGVETDERDACAMMLTGSAAAGVAGSLAFATWLCVPVAAAGLLAGVPAWSARRSESLKKQATEAMPVAFRTLAVAMGAGMTLVQAAEYAGAHVGGAVGGAFARLSLRVRCGMSTEEALEALRRELPVAGAGLLSTALVISHRTGSPLKGLFERSAKLVERQGEFERLLAVKTAQVRLSVRVVSLLPAAMVALLCAISPDFQAGLATPAGTACVCVAAALDVVAVLIIRRLVGSVVG